MENEKECDFFNRGLLRQALKSISFWERLLLALRPTKYSVDDECSLAFKELNGKVIIEAIEIRRPK